MLGRASELVESSKNRVMGFCIVFREIVDLYELLLGEGAECERDTIGLVVANYLDLKETVSRIDPEQ